MLTRVTSAIFYMLFALTLLAAATPAPWGAPPPVTTTATTTTTITLTPANPTQTIAPSQCNTGPIQCCNQVQTASSDPISALLGLLGIVLTDITALVGLGCSPISVIGVGGNSCSASPVCCQDNAVGGLISIGCLPINLGL